MADGFAGLAASSHSTPEADIQQTSHVDALVRALARRFVAITDICSALDSSRMVHSPLRVQTATVPRRSLAALAEASRHTWDKKGHSWRCLRCGVSVPDKRFRCFLGSEPPCTPQPAALPAGDAPTKLLGPVVLGGAAIHPTHDLWTKRGLIWCGKCGVIPPQKDNTTFPDSGGVCCLSLACLGRWLPSGGCRAPHHSGDVVGRALIANER
eukprot:13119538-Alexandrium_andersonii.AAC.1